MGSPSKSLVESLTDQIAAVIATDLDAGFRGEYSAKTVNALSVLLDASGDLALEGALMTHALGVDAMSLPENHHTALRAVTGREPLRNFATALRNYVMSSDGGSYASLRAYLVAVSAKIHPLYGELHRAVYGEGEFTASSVVGGLSVPAYSAVFPTRVYTGADGSLADDLTDATDVGTADVTLFGSDDHALYVGCDRKFEAVVVALSTLANTSVTPTFQYWNGNAWATLTVTDNSSGFTKNDAITFTAPSDWTRHYKDSGGTAFADLAPLYYVRIARTEDTVGTPPVGTCITLIPTYAPSSSGASTHLGIQQPPLALVRITAASTVTVTAPAAVDYTRFSHPLSSEGKIRLRALTPIAQDLTVTLAYTDHNGSNGSNAQSSWTAPAALGTKTVSLTNSTDGLRTVRTTTSVSTTATEGVFAVEVLPIRSPAV